MKGPLAGNRALLIPLWLIAVAAAIWLLGQLQTVIVPMILAFFLATILLPVHRWVRSRLPESLGGVGNVLVLLIPVALLCGVFGGVGWLITETLPAPDSASEAFAQFQDAANGMLARLPFETQDASQYALQLATQAQSSVVTVSMATIGILLTFYLLSLILSEVDELDQRIARALGVEQRDILLESVQTIGDKVRQFLLMRTVAGAISATLSLILFLVLGVDYAILWAVIVLALNYIPNIGSFIAAGPPILVATVTQGVGTGALVMVGMFTIEQLVGNVLDPRLQGKRLRLSPFMVLTSVVFFTWLWGIPGTLVAVPCLVLAVVTAEQIPALAPYAGLFRRRASSHPLTEDVHVANRAKATNQPT